MLQAYLQSDPRFELLLADSGLEALRVLSNEIIDIVLLDMVRRVRLCSLPGSVIV